MLNYRISSSQVNKKQCWRESKETIITLTQAGGSVNWHNTFGEEFND
jgi:hypothetical protein